MKQKVAYFVAALFSLLLLFNCKKEKIENDSPVQGSIGLKTKILEYGSEILLVCELMDSNFVFIKKMIDETKFIPKSATQQWNVNY